MSFVSEQFVSVFVEGFSLYQICPMKAGGRGMPCAVHHCVPSRGTVTYKHFINTRQKSESAVWLIGWSAQLLKAAGPRPGVTRPVSEASFSLTREHWPGRQG